MHYQKKTSLELEAKLNFAGQLGFCKKVAKSDRPRRNRLHLNINNINYGELTPGAERWGQHSLRIELRFSTFLTLTILGEKCRIRHSLINSPSTAS